MQNYSLVLLIGIMKDQMLTFHILSTEMSLFC